MTTTPLLEVGHLTITANSSDGNIVTIVEDFSMSLARGERVAIVGESGSGKSVTARALMHLDSTVSVTGSIRLAGRELIAESEKSLSKVRGSRIGMVFQDPLSALNPTMTIGAQVAEPLVARGVRRHIAHAKARSLLDELGIEDSETKMRAYPHEFSGGMRQRVALAMALINEPEILLADEPTTALDVRVQAQVMDLLSKVAEQRGLAVVLITHDLGVVADFADRVMVMYSGRVVEQASTEEILVRPAHPYTKGLLAAIPQIAGPLDRLVPLPGTPPSPQYRPSGCAFHPRCPLAFDRCPIVRPELVITGVGRKAACHLVPAAERGDLC